MIFVAHQKFVCLSQGVKVATSFRRVWWARSRFIKGTQIFYVLPESKVLPPYPRISSVPGFPFHLVWNLHFHVWWSLPGVHAKLNDFICSIMQLMSDEYTILGPNYISEQTSGTLYTDSRAPPWKGIPLQYGLLFCIKNIDQSEPFYILPRITYIFNDIFNDATSGITAARSDSMSWATSAAAPFKTIAFSDLDNSTLA